MNKILSKIMAGTVSLSLLAGGSSTVAAVELPQATLQWDTQYQVIDGFGASQGCDVYANDIYNFGKRDEVMDLLFSRENGIGLSIMRNEVGNGLNMPTIHPDPDTWDYTPYEPEQWVMQEAKKRGVEKMMSTVWSPPAWMKTTGKITNGGRLKKECYGDYAEYLVNYIKGHKEYYGIDIDAVSIANEPEYAALWQSCLWTGEEFADFLGNYLKPAFEAAGLETDVIVGEEATWTDKRLSAVYNNPNALATMDIVGGHFYHGKAETFPLAQQNNKHVWETEVSDTQGSSTDFKDGVKWSKYIHDFMTKSNANAFLYWLGASYKTNNESLIRLLQDGNYIAAKRLYSFGNFSKYVRPGYVRIGIDEHPYGNLYLSAYKNPETGEFAIVAVNDGENNETITLGFDGITCGQLVPHITNDRYDLQTFSPINGKNGTFQLSVSGYTTITYTGVANSPEPEERNWRVIDTLDDWSKVYERSDKWMLEGNNPYNAFDHDPSRARRTAFSPEYIIYQLDNMNDFEAIIYYYKTLEGVSFETSVDGQKWQSIQYIYEPARLTGGYWEQITVIPQDPLPEGTQYLKITFDKGQKVWDKHLAEIHMN